MEPISATNCSRHARVRIQQRGVTSEILKLHEEYADMECCVGNGCTSRTLTDSAASELRHHGISQQIIEKARKMAVLYSESQQIVTVLFVGAGHGRTYRRGEKKRYRSNPRNH